MFSYKI